MNSINFKDNETLRSICEFARRIYRQSYTEPEWIEIQIDKVEENLVTVYAVKHFPCAKPLRLPCLVINHTGDILSCSPPLSIFPMPPASEIDLRPGSTKSQS